ncbi:MAG: ion transporter [Flavobacteriales bacterium]|nr:ion transporter [Flavobacteriales bacterium]MCX7768437.1 ion transporter [Flavobacteriales bacterium]MDW8409670.1 ion transporter [Flavobacteriales bacterium]
MLSHFFLNNKFILCLIAANALIIFFQGFLQAESVENKLLDTADHILTLMFLIEALVKLRSWGIRTYFSDGWNVFDFILVVVALPSLVFWLTPVQVIQMDFLLALRVLRIFKFFRVLRFIPNVEHLILGVLRALRSSILVVFAFVIFNFIFAILSFYFFGHLAPEYFGNPLLAFYSTFKIFTVEGWYEVPDLIAERSNSVWLSVAARIYFVLMLFGGGIFGLSLINSIFVESMMSDSNRDLEIKVDELRLEIQQLRQSLESRTKTDRENS